MMRILKSRWFPLLAIAVLGGGALLLARSLQGSRAETPTWRTEPVTRGDIVVTVQGASGTIKPAAEVEVKSRATGVVQAVYVNEGDRVSKGQILVRIDDPDAAASVRSAQASLTGAQADYRQAVAGLQKAQAALRQTLAGNRPEEIAKGEQSVVSARADLDLATSNLERNRQLFQQGFIARQDLDTVEASAKAAQAQYQSAVENLRLLRAGSTADDVAAARATVAQSEAAVGVSQAQILQAQSTLANAQERLAETLIRAQVSGLVSSRSVEVGQTVIGGTATAGTSVIVIAVDQTIQAKIMLDEADITKIRSGLDVELQADSLPGETFHGKVLAVSPNSQTNNNVVQYEVTTSVQDPQHHLRLGMSVDASFIVARRTGVLVVPRQAITTTQGQATVRVLLSGEPVVRRVQTGESDDTTVEIRSGLQEGELVITGQGQTQSMQQGTKRQTNPFMPTPQQQRR